MNSVEDMKKAAFETQMAARADNHNDEAAAILLGGAAINLAVIAEAITKLQADMTGKPKDAPLNLRDLTEEERRVVIALRDGNLAIVTNETTGSTIKTCIVSGAFITTD